MTTYVCTDCRDPRVPDLSALAAIVAGVHWWTCDRIEIAQADAVHRLVRAGQCSRHAALLGDLVALTIRREREMRTVLPGTVTVRRIAIVDLPYEEATDVEVRKTVGRLRAFVAGQPLAAIVEHDREARRFRVTCQLVSDAGQPGEIIKARAIRDMTPQALIEVMRANERRRLERSG